MDKKEALKIVKNDPNEILNLPEKFQKDREVVLEIYDWINSLEGTEYSNDFESPKPYPSSKAGEFWGGT